MVFNRVLLSLLLMMPLLVSRPLLAQAEIVNTNTLDTQQQQLHSPDARTRIQAIRRLVEIKDSHTIELLLPLLKDPESPVRRSLADALVNLGGTQATDGLITLLTDKDENVADAAVSSLIKIGEPAAVMLAAKLTSPEAGVRAGALAVIGEVGKPVVTDTILPLCHDADMRVRANAVMALAQLHDPRAGAQAEAAMADQDAPVRASAVVALGRLNLPRSSAFAIRAVQDTDAHVRLNAVKVLARLAPDNIVDSLLPLFKDTDANIRFEVAQSLMPYRDSRLVDAYIAALPDPALIEPAMSALGSLHDVRAVMPLIAVVRANQDKLERTRDTALKALTQIGPPAVELLIGVLHDPNTRVRWYATQVLGAIGDRRALPSLQEAARDTEPEVRIAAVIALGALGDVAAEPVLITALKDADPEVGGAAARALRGTQNPAAIDPLLALVDDANQDNRYTERRRDAANTLAEMDDPRAIERMRKGVIDPGGAVAFTYGTPGKGCLRDPQMLALLVSKIPGNGFVFEFASDAMYSAANAGMVPQLLKCLHDPCAEVRFLAVGVLNQFSDPAITTAFLSLCDDPAELVRGEACSVLETRTDPTLLPELLKLLSQTDTGKRAMATVALGNYGTGQSELLVKLLHDPDSQVRIAAACALSKLKDPHTVPALCASLQDGAINPEEEQTVSLEALYALATIGDPRAVEPICALVTKASPKARGYILSFMGKFKDPRTVEMLLPLLQDKLNPNRLAVAAALGEIGDARAVSPLLAALSEQYTGDLMASFERYQVQRGIFDSLRNCVIIALGKIGDTRAVEPLLAMLGKEMRQTTDSDTKEALIDALGRLHEPRALKLILQAMRDRQNEPQWDPTTCADALKALGDSQAVMPLLQLRRIAPTYWNQRMEAVEEALGSFKDAVSKRQLLDSLTGDHWRLRATAARALGHRGERWAIVPLIACLADPQPQVRDAAADALKSLTGETFGGDAGKWQAWLAAHPAGT